MMKKEKIPHNFSHIGNVNFNIYVMYFISYMCAYTPIRKEEISEIKGREWE